MTKKRDDEVALLGKIARKAYDYMMQGGWKCDCPKYPDGDVYDGHLCDIFNLLDIITRDCEVSDAIVKEGRNALPI